MEKQYYMPHSEAAKQLWLSNFNAKLATYATKYGISKEELATTGIINNDYAYRLQAANKIAAYSKQWTAYKNALRDGIAPGAAVQAPTPPELGDVPTAAAPGAFSWLAAIVKKIKATPGYSPADGQDLQIEGAAILVDFTTLTPQVSIRTGSGGLPEIVWNKQDMDGVAIYKDNGASNGYTLYDLDNHPNWQDKHRLSAGETATWRYKLIYRLNNEEVGQWSTILSIMVSG